MNNSIVVSFFNLNKQLKDQFKFEAEFLNEESLELFYSNDPFELQTFLTGNKGVILFFKIENKRDFEKVLNILQSKIEFITNGMIRPVCISNVENNKFAQVLRRFNCLDILPYSTPPKTLKVKLRLWNRSLKGFINQNFPDDLKLTQRESDPVDVHSNKLINEETFSQEALELIVEDLKDIFVPKEIKINKDNVVDIKKSKRRFRQVNLESGQLIASLRHINDLSIEIPAMVDEFIAEEIVLETKNLFSSNIKELVIVSISFSYEDKQISVELEGLVSFVETISELCTLITIEFKKEEQEKFKDFMMLYQKRQKNISDFFDDVKGF